MTVAEILKAVPLFQDLDAKSLRRLARIARLKVYRRGETILKEGSVGRDLYVLKSGSVSILKRGPEDEPRVLARLEPCAPFGEMSLIDRQPRSASVVASEDTELLVLDGDEFLRFLDSDPATAARVYRALASIFCQRLRASNERMVAWEGRP